MLRFYPAGDQQTFLFAFLARERMISSLLRSSRQQEPTMLVRVLARLVFIQILLSGVFLVEPVFAQQPSSELATTRVDAIELIRAGSPVDLDIYLQGPGSVSVEEPAALILVTPAGQTYRQGTTKKGHLRWNEIPAMQYGVQVVAPGFERAVQEVDAHGNGEVKVIVQLRP
jgi:hypothetical protein